MFRKNITLTNAKLLRDNVIAVYTFIYIYTPLVKLVSCQSYLQGGLKVPLQFEKIGEFLFYIVGDIQVIMIKNRKVICNRGTLISSV